MATTTTKLALQLPADGEAGWGAMLRANFTKLDQSAAGQNLIKTVTGGTYTLSLTESGCDSFEFNGVLTANQIIIVPNNMPPFAVENLCTGNFTLTVKTALGASIVVDQATICMMYCNGTNTEYICGAQMRTLVTTTGGTTTLGHTDLAGGAVEISGALISNATIVVPNNCKPFFAENMTTGAFTVTVKTAAGTGAVIPYGNSLMYCNGTNGEYVEGSIVGQLISTATTAVGTAATKIALGGKAFDNGGLTLDIANSRFTCVNPGVYNIAIKAGGTTTAVAQTLQLQAYKNGVAIAASAAPQAKVANTAAVAGELEAMIDFYVSMVTGDYIEGFATGSVASGVTLGIGRSSLKVEKM